MFMATLIFLLYPAVKKRSTDKVQIIDLVFICSTLASGIYLVSNFHAIALRAGAPTTWDVIFGLLMILSVLEVARRIVGLTLPMVALCALLYAYFGPYLPAIIGHRGYSIP